MIDRMDVTATTLICVLNIIYNKTGREYRWYTFSINYAVHHKILASTPKDFEATQNTHNIITSDFETEVLDQLSNFTCIT